MAETGGKRCNRSQFGTCSRVKSHDKQGTHLAAHILRTKRFVRTRIHESDSRHGALGNTAVIHTEPNLDIAQKRDIGNINHQSRVAWGEGEVGDSDETETGRVRCETKWQLTCPCQWSPSPHPPSPPGQMSRYSLREGRLGRCARRGRRIRALPC